MNEKSKGRGSNTVIAVLIVLIGLSAVAATIFFSLSKTTPEDGYFNPKKRGTAQKLYTELTEVFEETAEAEGAAGDALDKFDKYPQTPEEVVALYLKGTRLLYGDMTEDESVIPIILRAQRHMYTKELLEKTSLENQETMVKSDIKKLKEENVVLTECTTQPVIFYENDLTKGYVRVTFEYNGSAKRYFKYYLQRDEEGFWKIEGYQKSNESFSD